MQGSGLLEQVFADDELYPLAVSSLHDSGSGLCEHNKRLKFRALGYIPRMSTKSHGFT